MDAEGTRRLETFKGALRGGETDVTLVRQFVIHGTPYCFHQDEGLYFELKRVVSERFEVHPENVSITGSAKLGFSIAPQKLWKPFDDDSDIDLVIVSDAVFDRYWKAVLEIDVNLTPRDRDEDETYRRFLEYFFRGWLRPDLMPFDYTGKPEWFEFFRGISYGRFGGFKVAAAVFREMYHLELYQSKNIARIRRQVEA